MWAVVKEAYQDGERWRGGCRFDGGCSRERRAGCATDYPRCWLQRLESRGAGDNQTRVDELMGKQESEARESLDGGIG